MDRLTILEIFMRGNVYRDLHPTNTSLQGKLDWRDRKASRGGGRPGLTITPTVRAWAEECGITWVRTLVATDGNGRGPERQRPMTRCTRCGILCRAVQYVEHGEYVCFWCGGGNNRLRLWFSLGKYACGIRLGCTDRVMRRWRLMLLRHGAHRVPKTRKLEDLALLAAIGALAGPELPKRVIVVRGRDRGLWPAVQRNYVPAVIDSLLHRDAYMLRFGGG